MFRLSTKDQSREETGYLKKVGDSVVHVTKGSYQFTTGNGTRYFVEFTADENGYHPIIHPPDQNFWPKEENSLEPYIDSNVLKSLVGKR